MAGPIVADGSLVGWGSNTYEVRAIRRPDAVALIKAHHYSGTTCSASYINLGVFRVGDPEIRGVLQLGPALNPASGHKIIEGISSREWCELNRMWVAASEPRNTESHVIALVMRYIAKKYPQIVFVQSFADERCGCLGVVYQAANFTYHGCHRSDFLQDPETGETFHKMMLYPTAAGNGPRWRRAQELFAAGRLVKNSYRQFRYIYWIKPKMRQKCKLKEQAYPKPQPVLA